LSWTIVIYDNATIHAMRDEDAPSACHMPRNTPNPKSKAAARRNWLVPVFRVVDGKRITGPGGRYIKDKVKMRNLIRNGVELQQLYFPDDHPTHPGVFKGMAVLLEERGYVVDKNLKAQCKDFKCREGATDCCCRRILYDHPDFAHFPSALEMDFKHRGYKMTLSPKFHCELQSIEQCWGYGKRRYREYNESHDDNEMVANIERCLDEIPLVTIRR
jgi:hypothetical protein